MRARNTALLTILALAAATGAGVWVSGAGDGAQHAPEPIAPGPIAAIPTPELAAKPVIVVGPELAKEPVVASTSPKVKKDDAAEKKWEQAAFTKKFDADGDGKLSKEEWSVAKQSSPQKQQNSRLQALMGVLKDRYDADRDGELSQDERQVLNEEFGAAKRQIVSDIMPRYDLDGDGRLTGEEKEAAGPEFQEAFDRLGVFALLDGDGSWDIDPVELALAIAAMGEGDELMDLNGDGKIDHRDAALAADVASSGG